MPDATWVEALRKTGHVDACIVVDKRKCNASMSKSSLFSSVMTSRFDGSNPTPRVLRINFKHPFFTISPEWQVSHPRPLDHAWKEKVLEAAAQLLAIPSKRARPPALLESPAYFLENSDNKDESIAVPNINSNLQTNGRGLSDGTSHQVQSLAH